MRPGAVVGNILAPDKTLATLPISAFVVGMAVSTLPVGAIARLHGRRAAFLVGTGAGVIAGLLATGAVLLGSFWLYCLAAFLGGAYAAVVLSFRFAAADCVPFERRARAMSFVMAGGVFAGVIGPQLVTHTMDLWPPYLFAATHVAQAAVAAVSALVPRRRPHPDAEPDRDRGRTAVDGDRPPAAFRRRRHLRGRVLHGHELPDDRRAAGDADVRSLPGSANTGLQWHIIAMYAPGFFTGHLITRFGAPRVVAAGLTLIALSAAAGLMGVDVPHFWVMLILLGVGWNFGFVGASALVLGCHRPEERTRVQSLNDFLVFGTMTIGSLSSGGLLTTSGWSTVLAVSFVPLAAAVLALVVMRVSNRAAFGGGSAR